MSHKINFRQIKYLTKFLYKVWEVGEDRHQLMVDAQRSTEKISTSYLIKLQ